MAIGVSYFGSRILRHVEADMADLAERGFTGVLHTFSENDLHWYRDQMTRIVEVSHANGLEVQVNPWGMAHVFGGEAESLFAARHPELGQVFDDGGRVGAACPSRPAFVEYAKEWADAAVESGADRVFWDEPHLAHPSTFGRGPDAWTCRCEACRAGFVERFGEDMPTELTPEVQTFRDDLMTGFVTELVAHVDAIGGRSTVCLLPTADGLHALGDWETVAAAPGLDTLATDPYWAAFDQPVDPFVGELSQQVADLAAANDVTAQVWIQGFGLDAGDADDIRTAVAAARAAGVTDLWTWGYESCAHMSHLATPDAAETWEVLSAALTGRG